MDPDLGFFGRLADYARRQPMQALFAGSLATLALASFVRVQTLPGAGHNKPIIYWVTDNNPARTQQVNLFHEWLDKQRALLGADQVPDVVLEIDTANNDVTKLIVQGIARVGGDIIQTYPHEGYNDYLDKIGLLEDLTDDARAMGFGPDATFPAMRSDLYTQTGKQVVFPANVSTDAQWINVTTFKKFGMDPPPRRWTVDEFERIGREFTRRANEGRPRQDHFFCGGVDTTVLLRSAGVDTFDETRSGSGYDRQAFVDTIARYRRWIYVDRILPSDADLSSANVQAGYGGPVVQLFILGKSAMFRMGRYGLIALRTIPEDQRPELDVSEDPYVDFPNSIIFARAIGVYSGGKHKDAAKWFVKFLASEEYNNNIIDDADSLPPNPAYCTGEAFFSPPKYPNEHKVHRAFLDIANDIALPLTQSPFVLTTEAKRVSNAVIEGVKADPALYTPEEARAQVLLDFASLVRWNLKENPELEPAYRKAREDQAIIDRLRESGAKIPASLITNDYYKHYYRAMGRLDEGK